MKNNIKKENLWVGSDTTVRETEPEYNEPSYEIGDHVEIFYIYENEIFEIQDIDFEEGIEPIYICKLISHNSDLLDEEDDYYEAQENEIIRKVDEDENEDLIENKKFNMKRIKTFEAFANESVGDLEDSFVDINIDETDLETSDRPKLGKLKQKTGKVIIETPSKTDAYNAKMSLGGDTIQEPGFADKQIHHVKDFKNF